MLKRLHYNISWFDQLTKKEELNKMAGKHLTYFQHDNFIMLLVLTALNLLPAQSIQITSTIYIPTDM